MTRSGSDSRLTVSGASGARSALAAVAAFGAFVAVAVAGVSPAHGQVSHAPTGSETYFREPLARAIAAERTGDMRRAWDQVLVAVENAPEAQLPAAHRTLAAIARDSGHLPDAVSVLKDQARGRDKRASSAEATLGQIRLWQHDFRTGIAHCERAASLDPDALPPYVTLIECQLAAGDRSFLRLDRLRGRVGVRWSEITARAMLLDAAARTAEAVALYEIAARMAPAEFEIPMRLAIAQGRLGQHNAAEASLARAERLLAGVHPSRRAPGEQARAAGAIERTRAVVLLRSSRFDGAIDAAMRARSLATELGDRTELAAAVILEARTRAERGSSQAGRQLGNQGLRLARHLGDASQVRAALEALALLDLHQFETRSAREQLKEALALSAETGDARGIESTLTLLGLTSAARGEYLESLAYFNDAATRSAAAGNAYAQQQSIEGASRAHYLLSNHWQALDLATHALVLAEQIGSEAGVGQSALTAGRAALVLGLNDQAEEYLARAAEIGSRLGLARLEGRALLDLGRLSESLGQADQATAWYERALALARRSGDPSLESDGVSSIGEGFFELGAYEEALHQYERALAMATESGYLEGRLRNLTRAGEALKLLGDTRRSVALFRESLRLSEGIKNRVSQASNYSNLGEIYATLGDHNRSVAFLNRALKVNRETGSVLGESQSLLALCRAQNLTRSAAAADQCGIALSFAERHGQEAQRARAAIELGNALFNTGQLDKAESYFETGRRLAHELERPSIQWPAAAGMAQVLAAQGQNEPAVAMGREAVETLERLRSQLDLPEMRASFLEDKLEPYEQLVLLLIRQGLLSEAFRTMEYSRSRTFLEILADAPANGNVPQGATERIADLRRRTYDTRREILARTEDLAALPASADRDSTTTAMLRGLSELRKQHEALQEEIRRAIPGGLAAGTEPMPLDVIQSMLSRDEAVLEYYVTRNELVIFVIARDGVRAIIEPQSEMQLAARVKLYQTAVSQNPATGGGRERWFAPASALTQALLDPVRSDPLIAGRDHLIVVPHKFLHHVPFQALLSRRQTAGERPRFLIEDYTMSYAPSSSVLKHCREQVRGRRQTALALANPTPRMGNRQELLYAEEELAAVKNVFAGAVIGVGAEATETRVKNEAGDYDLLHLATHYAVNERDPMRSALDLTPSADDDGRLEVREVMDLGVGADLVVVSGCSTANGEIAGECPNGDDWLGLTRAFMQAGAPSVVATLWPVNDRSSARFMDRFYEVLQAEGKGGALASAQRAMLAGKIPGAADLQDPYYWAPFVLIGAAN